MNRKKMIGVVFLCTVLVSIASAFIVSGVSTVIDNSFLSMLLNQLLLLLPSAVYIIKSRTNLKKSIRLKKISPSNIVLCIVFAFLIMPVMNLINAISLLFSKNMIQDTVTDIVSNNALFLSVFVIAFIPCLFEETIFRGIFYNEYRKSNIKVGIVLSAFLFGIMHQNFNQFSYAFAMGIVFALLIEATDSIVSTMIVHFIINANSVIMTYMLPKLTKILQDLSNSVEGYEDIIDTTTTVTKEAILSSMTYYCVSAAIASILSYLVYKTIAKNTGRWQHVKAIFSSKAGTLIKESDGPEELDEIEAIEEKQGGMFTIPLVIGIVICVVLMVVSEVFVEI
ncbi:CPBP family intramembrane glutamic endopeptidase [Anaerosporobacter sp.]